MAHHHGHPRYEIRNARVAWEYWTFWHRFKNGRVDPEAKARELVNIGTHGLEFNSRQPPEKGSKLLLNVMLPGYPEPFVVRGVVSKIKSREGHESVRVGVKIPKCPGELVDRIKELGETVL